MRRCNGYWPRASANGHALLTRLSVRLEESEALLLDELSDPPISTDGFPSSRPAVAQRWTTSTDMSFARYVLRCPPRSASFPSAPRPARFREHRGRARCDAIGRPGTITFNGLNVLAGQGARGTCSSRSRIHVRVARHMRLPSASAASHMRAQRNAVSAIVAVGQAPPRRRRWLVQLICASLQHYSANDGEPKRSVGVRAWARMPGLEKTVAEAVELAF